jgi:cytochrome c biogenesis protein CcdA
VAAAVIALLLLGLATAIATAQEGVVTAMQASSRHVRRWGGVVLIVVGAWLLATAVFADFFAEVFPV